MADLKDSAPPHASHDPLVTRVIETLRQGVHDDEQVRSLVQGAAQPMLILDEATRILAVNDRGAALLEREPAALAGKTFAGLVHPGHRKGVRERLERALRTGQGPDDVETRLQSAAGPVHATLTFLPFRTRDHDRLALLVRDDALGAKVRRLARDLAQSEVDLAQSRQRLARNQKLTDLGELLSGVAHELKTPATYVENLAVLAERKLESLAATARPEDAALVESIRRDAAEIREGAGRIRHLLLELQPLTRNQPTTRAPVDLADLVRDAVRSFEGSAGSRTRIELDLQSTHPVSVDKREMSRVVLNLLKNASEAMEGAGRVVIQTRNRDCPPRIRVEDEGPGIPPDLEARIFEPFFTTKPDGTGLGLVISKRIVENNGGTLRHERAPGGGAAFVIEFGPGAPP